MRTDARLVGLDLVGQVVRDLPEQPDEALGPPPGADDEPSPSQWPYIQKSSVIDSLRGSVMTLIVPVLPGQQVGVDREKQAGP